MASEIHPTPGVEEAKAAEMGSNVAISDPPVLLTGPKTTITPRTNSAPRGKIFEDEVRGTVFWEVAESSDDEEEDEAENDQPQEKEGAKWGNPFKIEWIKW
jgi:YT521-B-like domain